MFKLAICEDDKYQIDINKGLIYKWAESKKISVLIDSFFSAEEFIIKNESILRYDCIIIDVRLKCMDGIELAKVIRKNNNSISIIFVSGLKEFIGLGYDVDAINYLIKPLNEEKLFKSLDKALNNKYNNKEKSDILTIKKAGEIINLKFNDILFCESYRHYIEINTKDSKIRIKKKISDLEDELNKNLFIRTHKSYIVNIAKTKEIKKSSIILINDIEVPISKMKKKAVKEMYFKYF